MKKLYTLLTCLIAYLPFALAQTPSIDFVDAVKIANNNFNLGFKIEAQHDLFLTARNQAPLDIGLGGTPLLLNAGNFESAVYAKFDLNFSSTGCGGYIDGTDNVYMFDSDVNEDGETLICGRFTGAVTVNANTYTCGGTHSCAFAAVIDNNCAVTDFLKLEGTDDIIITDIAWSSNNNIVASISYKGDFNQWGHTFTSAGNSDVVIAKISSPGSSTATYVTVSGTGNEAVEAITPDVGPGLLIAVSETNPAATATFTHPSGGTTTLNLSSNSITNWILGLDSNLNLINTLTIGSNSGIFDIENIIYSPDGIFLGGTLWGQLHPDPNNSGTVILSNGSSKMCVVKYDYPGLTYKGSFISPTAEQEVIQSAFKLLNYYANPKLGVAGFGDRLNELVQGGSPDSRSFLTSHAIFYVLDTNLVIVDSMIIGATPGGYGFCQFYGSGMDSLGNIYFTGFFNDSIDFDPSPDSVFHLIGTSGAYGDIFIAKYSTPVLTGINNPEISESLTVFPVPAKDKITIQLRMNAAADGRLRITDIQGKTMFTKDFKNTAHLNVDWQTSNNSAGVYLLTFESDRFHIVKKVVLMD